MYGITRSMSRAGTPTDNAAMEAINGWIKAELFMDLHVTGEKPVQNEIVVMRIYSAKKANAIKSLRFIHAVKSSF